jgi:hypothetical protein
MAHRPAFALVPAILLNGLLRPAFFESKRGSRPAIRGLAIAVTSE